MRVPTLACAAFVHISNTRLSAGPRVCLPGARVKFNERATAGFRAKEPGGTPHAQRREALRGVFRQSLELTNGQIACMATLRTGELLRYSPLLQLKMPRAHRTRKPVDYGCLWSSRNSADRRGIRRKRSHAPPASGAIELLPKVSFQGRPEFAAARASHRHHPAIGLPEVAAPCCTPEGQRLDTHCTSRVCRLSTRQSAIR
jgi:hypothetical protein